MTKLSDEQLISYLRDIIKEMDKLFIPKFKNPELVKALREKMNLSIHPLLEKIGKQRFQSTHNIEVIRLAHDIWRRCFLKNQGKKRGILLQICNDTRNMLIEHDFFIDYGLMKKSRTLFFEYYMIMSLHPMEVLIEKLRVDDKNTLKKLINVKVKGKNVFQYAENSLSRQLEELKIGVTKGTIIDPTKSRFKESLTVAIKLAEILISEKIEVTTGINKLLVMRDQFESLCTSSEQIVMKRPPKRQSSKVKEGKTKNINRKKICMLEDRNSPANSTANCAETPEKPLVLFQYRGPICNTKQNQASMASKPTTSSKDSGNVKNHDVKAPIISTQAGRRRSQLDLTDTQIENWVELGGVWTPSPALNQTSIASKPITSGKEKNDTVKAPIISTQAERRRSQLDLTDAQIDNWVELGGVWTPSPKPKM